MRPPQGKGHSQPHMHTVPDHKAILGQQKVVPTLSTILGNATVREMFTRLRFSEDAALKLVDEQNVDSIDELRNLTIEECSGLCDLIRQNKSTSVSLIAENNLKLAVYYVRHQDRISRSCTIESIDRHSIRDVRDLRDTELKHFDPELIYAPKFNTKDREKAIEAVRDFLAEHRGVTGVPLSYVVRPDKNVKPEARDPATNYGNQLDEMIARAPIIDEEGRMTGSFSQDNRKVWDIVKYIFRDTEFWAHIQDCQRQHDGRRAFINLWSSYTSRIGEDDIVATRSVEQLEETKEIVPSNTLDRFLRSTSDAEVEDDRDDLPTKKEPKADKYEATDEDESDDIHSLDGDGRSARSGRSTRSYLDRFRKNRGATDDASNSRRSRNSVHSRRNQSKRDRCDNESEERRSSTPQKPILYDISEKASGQLDLPVAAKDGLSNDDESSTTVVSGISYQLDDDLNQPSGCSCIPFACGC